MEQENVKKLLTKIIDSKGFINLDQNDINMLKDGVDSIDAVMLKGTDEQIGELLLKAINYLKETNKEKLIKKLLFAIRLPKDNNFMMNNMSKVHEVLDILDENIECVWGISTNEELESNYLELIVAAGLNINN